MPFQLKIDDKVFNTDDFTMAEAVKVEEISGETWLRMNPIYSATVCRAMMIVALSREITEGQARARVDSMTVDQALECIEQVDDDRPVEYEDGIPKSEAEPDASATTGSSGASGSSDGLPT